MENEINKEEIKMCPQFSVFGMGIKSTNPEAVWDLIETYRYIIGDEAKDATEHLRLLSNKAEARDYKAGHFRFCTFSGVFNRRAASALVSHSGLMTIDIDDIESSSELSRIRELLIHDKKFDTAMLFVSPSGNGIKWIPFIGNITADRHGEWFDCIKNYLVFEYGISIDKSGRDVCRTCFLPHDAECYLNPEYLNDINDKTIIIKK